MSVIGLAAVRGPFENRANPQRVAYDSFRAMGHEMLYAPLAPKWPLFPRRIDVLLTWNGVHAGRSAFVPQARREGVGTVILERGFFDRMNHCQVDHLGWNHTASWSQSFDGTAPETGAAKLAESFGPTRPVQARDRGYILVLLQKAGDTQLIGASIALPDSLVAAVEQSVPDGLDIMARPHPKARWRRTPGQRAKIILGSLRDAVAGARFVVTINSNAGNEALAWGCPVLCLGPSVYGRAGVVMTATPETLASRIHLMLRGYCPAEPLATAYLRWLASRQFSNDELRQGDCLREALNNALEARCQRN